jgi:hypothetical protein
MGNGSIARLAAVRKRLMATKSHQLDSRDTEQ